MCCVAGPQGRSPVALRESAGAGMRARLVRYGGAALSPSGSPRLPGSGAQVAFPTLGGKRGAELGRNQ